jgi:DNA-directed RNA polymerase specialized sigma24 family protein
MSEKPKEEFEDEEPDELEEAAEDLDVDRLMRDFDTRKRRGARAAAAEPAWRKLERLREEKRTAGLLSDFEDYEVDESGAGTAKKPRRVPAPRRR